jgi:hypothetical protein
MNWKLGMVMLAIGFAACGKKENSVGVEVDERAAYIDLAEKIRKDTTIEHSNILAFACEQLFDIEHDFHIENIQVSDVLEMMQLSTINGQLLLEIDYPNFRGKEEFEKDIFVLDSTNNILHKTTIPGTRYANVEIESADWDGDGIEDLICTIDHPTSSVDVNNEMIMVYQYAADKEITKTFELSKEYRNCSAVMRDKWNYISRSYSFTSTHEITVVENYFMIDCEQYERTESISKLRKIKSENYTMKWNDRKGMFVKN